MEIRAKSGKPFKTEAALKKALFDLPGEFDTLEAEGGWIGIETTKLPSQSAIGSPISDYQDSIVDSKKSDRAEIALKDMSGLEVQCPGCGQVYHKTTNQYDPDIDANPSMLVLVEPYVSYGWTQITGDSSMGYGCIVCPDCGTALSPSGTLRIKNG
jgi:hypothetical protein